MTSQTEPAVLALIEKPKPYQPGSGLEGAEFMAAFCDRCAKDQAFRDGTGDSCPIIANSMVYDQADAEYPPELILDPHDGYPTCTAFDPVPILRAVSTTPGKSGGE
jgi:hypothetical protein